MGIRSAVRETNDAFRVAVRRAKRCSRNQGEGTSLCLKEMTG